MGIFSVFKNILRRPADEKGARVKPVAPSPGAAQPSAASGTPVTLEHAPDAADVLRGPLVTEKSTRLVSQNQYVFRVAPDATKVSVRQAVEMVYRVHVTDVHMVNLPGKVRRRGRVKGFVSGSRKAVVSVRPGEHIDLTSSVAFDRAPARVGAHPSVDQTSVNT